MKLLFIRNAGRFSGSETYTINLFKELGQNPFLNIYFLTNLPLLAKRATDCKIKTYIITWGKEGIGTKRQLFLSLLTLPLILIKYLTKIREIEKGHRFEVVCLQSMTEKIFLTPFLKIRGYKIIWTELGPIYATRMSRIITFFYKVVSNIVNKIITISDDTRKDLINGGVSSSKIITIHIGIDIKEFRPQNRQSIVRKELKIPAQAIVIGFLGTITNEKGIEDFIKVSEELL